MTLKQLNLVLSVVLPLSQFRLVYPKMLITTHKGQSPPTRVNIKKSFIFLGKNAINNSIRGQWGLLFSFLFGFWKWDKYNKIYRNFFLFLPLKILYLILLLILTSNLASFIIYSRFRHKKTLFHTSIMSAKKMHDIPKKNVKNGIENDAKIYKLIPNHQWC